MSVTLEPVFHALGYDTPAKQRGLITLLQAAGAFGQLPGVSGVLSDKQAGAVLAGVTFEDAQQAASWLHDVTQSCMKRPEGQGRDDTPERKDFITHRRELLAALTDAGVVSDVKPRLASYDHVLLLGSRESMAETRLQSIKALWDEGIRFDKIHLLGSERPLDESNEPIAAAMSNHGGNQGDNQGGSLSTETEMLKVQYYAMREDWPQELKQVPVYAVGSFDRDDRHANTKDTIETWLSMRPEPAQGNVLVISNQPYVAYQDAAVKSVLPPSFHVETVGASVDARDVNISLAMDAIARQIDVNFAALLQQSAKLSEESAPSLAMLDPARIKADPQTYQFRSHYDASGVTEKGRYHAKSWDAVLHGDPLLVHERLDGSLYVADGHHRLKLAQELNQQGKGPGQVAAVILREADGYTPRDVKIIAAYKNIAQGTTDPVETARVFREADSGQVHQAYLPKLQMDKGNLKLSYSLSKLSDKALGEVERGALPADMAAEVANRVSDRKEQEAVIEAIEDEIKTGQGSFAARYASSSPSAPKAPSEQPERYADRVRQPSAPSYGVTP